MLAFVNIETLNKETDAKIRSALQKLHPRFIRWLKDVYVSDDTVTLCYNINNPTERFLRKDLVPLLKEQGLPHDIAVEKVRPGVLHASALEFLNKKLKPRANEDNYISDLAWLNDDDGPFIAYLSLYRFIQEDWEYEVIGLDLKENKLWSRRWIVGIAITEAEGNELLIRWLEQSANKTLNRESDPLSGSPAG